MIISPAIIALIASAVITTLMYLYASIFAIGIIRKWDIKSGSESQIILERRTYLISTMVAYALGFEALSLLLYVHTAEAMHEMFSGAMCAAGTLNVGRFGYQTLILKIVVVFFASIWIIINRADNKAHDYPLIKHKYAMLLFIAPIAAGAAAFQIVYLSGLKADVITSCCGSLFSAGQAADGASGGLREIMSIEYAYYPLILASAVFAFVFYKYAKAGLLTGALSLIAFPVSLIAITNHVSPYIYELPTHRCPFCLLQSDYGIIGYILYLAVFIAGICGTGVGVLGIFERKAESLALVMPGIRRRLALAAAIAHLMTAVVSAYAVSTSNLVAG